MLVYKASNITVLPILTVVKHIQTCLYKKGTQLDSFFYFSSHLYRFASFALHFCQEDFAQAQMVGRDLHVFVFLDVLKSFFQ